MRVFVQNGRLRSAVICNGGRSVMRVQAWVEPLERRERRKRGPASQKLDSQFIIKPNCAPDGEDGDSPASFLSCVGGARAHTPVPSLQMHMWVRLSVDPVALRAAPRELI